MKFIREDISQNPTFNTVVGLSNTTFDPENYVANRGATEGQIKVVHDMIKALQDWLDENGCSNDPYAIIKAKVDELEAAIDECCANPQDTLVQMLNERMDSIEAAMNTCCQAMDDNLYQMLVDRLDALEDSINCDPCGGGGSIGNCDGNNITVSFSWDDINKTSGKATATSAMSDHNIVGYYFLVNNNGIYHKSASAGVGNFGYTIDSSGNVTMYSSPTSLPCNTIIAVDDHGCEGTVYIGLLLTGNAVGG